MNDHGKSDSSIVLRKPPNNSRDASRLAEEVEGRGLAKGNSVERSKFRTQCRRDLQQALDRVRQVASPA